MKVAIMQPYFMAYIGYYQLINSVDKFVVYDNIEFSKKGWFNRNRILLNGKEKLFTIPLKSGSDYLPVDQRYLAENSLKERNKVLQWVKSSYKKAPFYSENFNFIEKLFLSDEDNLFEFIYSSIQEVCRLLSIETEIIVSSKLPTDLSLKGEDKVLAICGVLNADTYINAIGGKELYHTDRFVKNDVELKFIQTHTIQYEQFSNEFVPWLSIIDVLMFNGVEKTKLLLNKYELE